MSSASRSWTQLSIIAVTVGSARTSASPSARAATRCNAAVVGDSRRIREPHLDQGIAMLDAHRASSHGEPGGMAAGLGLPSVRLTTAQCPRGPHAMVCPPGGRVERRRFWRRVECLGVRGLAPAARERHLVLSSYRIRSS